MQKLSACNTISCPVALRAPRGGPPGSLLPGMGRDRMREASPRRSCGADRRGRATKQTAPRRRNPKGRSSLTGRIERLSGLAKLDLRNGQFVLLQALKLLVPPLVLLAVGCAAGPREIAPAPDVRAAVADLEGYIREEMEDQGLPGLSIAILEGEETVWA